MTERSLRGCTILVVEDEYLLAADLCAALVDRGAQVVGPAATVSGGKELLQNTPNLSSAILDVNLRGEPVFALADELIARDVPFVFTTGYDASIIPERFSIVRRCEKPVRIAQVVEAIGRMADS
jgi:DNA-binding NtrC family response regulator